jgi:opacity protein-like surface antigen
MKKFALLSVLILALLLAACGSAAPAAQQPAPEAGNASTQSAHEGEGDGGGTENEPGLAGFVPKGSGRKVVLHHKVVVSMD